MAFHGASNIANKLNDTLVSGDFAATDSMKMILFERDYHTRPPQDFASLNLITALRAARASTSTYILWSDQGGVRQNVRYERDVSQAQYVVQEKGLPMDDILLLNNSEYSFLPTVLDRILDVHVVKDIATENWIHWWHNIRSSDNNTLGKKIDARNIRNHKFIWKQIPKRQVQDLLTDSTLSPIQQTSLVWLYRLQLVRKYQSESRDYEFTENSFLGASQSQLLQMLCLKRSDLDRYPGRELITNMKCRLYFGFELLDEVMGKLHPSNPPGFSQSMRKLMRMNYNCRVHFPLDGHASHVAVLVPYSAQVRFGLLQCHHTLPDVAGICSNNAIERTKNIAGAVSYPIAIDSGNYCVTPDKIMAYDKDNEYYLRFPSGMTIPQTNTMTNEGIQFNVVDYLVACTLFLSHYDDKDYKSIVKKFAIGGVSSTDEDQCEANPKIENIQKLMDWWEYRIEQKESIDPEIGERTGGTTILETLKAQYDLETKASSLDSMKKYCASLHNLRKSVLQKISLQDPYVITKLNPKIDIKKTPLQYDTVLWSNCAFLPVTDVIDLDTKERLCIFPLTTEVPSKFATIATLSAVEVMDLVIQGLMPPIQVWSASEAGPGLPRDMYFNSPVFPHPRSSSTLTCSPSVPFQMPLHLKDSKQQVWSRGLSVIDATNNNPDLIPSSSIHRTAFQVRGRLRSAQNLHALRVTVAPGEDKPSVLGLDPISIHTMRYDKQDTLIGAAAACVFSRKTASSQLQSKTYTNYFQEECTTEREATISLQLRDAMWVLGRGALFGHIG